MRPLVDTHCHLGHHEGLTVAEQLDRARSAGLVLLVDVGTDVASSRAAAAVAAAEPDVLAAVGIHPNDAGTATPAALAELDLLAALPRVAAVGEIGLDRYRDRTSPAVQEAAFRAQLAIADRHDRTVMIHCRDAWDDCVRILEEEGWAGRRVVLHCYSGDPATTRRTIGNGWFHSFAGNVTFTNAGPLREVAALVPTSLLLTETDAPFLTPHPHRGTPNDPSLVGLTLARLADVRGEDPDVLAAAVVENTRRALPGGVPGPHGPAGGGSGGGR